MSPIKNISPFGPPWWELRAALLRAVEDSRPTWGEDWPTLTESVAEYAVQKLVVAESNLSCQRMTFGNALQYASSQLKDKLIVLSNADIFLDDTAARLLKPGRWTWKTTALAILRWEYRDIDTVEGSGEMLWLPRTDSQDTWVLRTPSSAQLFRANARNDLEGGSITGVLDFEMGQLRCDNRFAHVLEEYLELTVLNPSLENASLILIVASNIHQSEPFASEHGTKYTAYIFPERGIYREEYTLNFVLSALQDCYTPFAQ